MIVSPFTPLFFHAVGQRSHSDGADSPYIQTFAKTDAILIEFFANPGESPISLRLYDANRDESTELTPNQWTTADGGTLYFCVLRGLPGGVYSVTETSSNIECYPFRIANDAAELANTVLIQYSMKDNKQREDAMFVIDGMRHFFDFRVPGGFKDSEISFGCESEQFTTQHGDICNLYALETTQCKFTMGGGEGVPARFGELLNRLLCCTYVYFDGVRYARKDASVPEINIQIDGVDSFVFKQSLQKVTYLNPTIENDNLTIMRRVDNELYRIDSNNHNFIIK